MARPTFDKKIPLEIENLHVKHPKWKATDIHRELIKKYGKPTPSSSYIRNKLREIKIIEAKGSVLDQPWSLASLTTYPVPYDILPWLSWLAEYDRKQGIPLRIGDALWIGRLSVFPAEDKDPNRRTGETVGQLKRRLNRYLARLTHTAIRLMRYERGCEKIGLTPVDSSQFDGSSLEQICKNFNRYHYGNEDDVSPIRKVDKRIVEAWIRLSKGG